MDVTPTTRIPTDLVKVKFLPAGAKRKVTWYTKNPRIKDGRISFIRYTSEGFRWAKDGGKNEDGIPIEIEYMFFGFVKDVEIIPLVMLPFYGEYEEA